jgi:ribose 5-phosphate isomerase B
MIVLASDHGGFPLKEQVKEYLKTKGLDVIDVGTDSTDSCDFPVFVKKAVNQITSNQNARGILVCGSGLGVSIAANRNPEIRAALCHRPEYAELSRQHNNANVLCLGGRFLTFDEAIKIIDIFLSTEFLGGKYHTRNQMF